MASPAVSISSPNATLLCNRCNPESSPEQNYRAQTQETLDRHRAHYYLTPSERNETTVLLQEARNSLTQFDVEIARAKCSLEKMEQSRVDRQRYIDALASLQAPVHRLPTELVLRIFHYVVSSKETWNLITRDRRQPACFNLASVNTRWRDIALSSKEVWAFIGVELEVRDSYLNPTPEPDAETVAFMTTALQKCISRSDPAPLSIWLTGPDFAEVRDRFKPCSEHPLLELLALQARRWREAEFRIAHKYLQPVSSLSRIEGHLPILEKLTIPLCDAHNLHPTQLFNDCPRLSNVAIARGLLSGGTPLLPSHQITTLRVEECLPAQFLEFLNSFPQLTSLFVKPYLDWETDNAPLPQVAPVSFGNLRSLSICFEYWSFEHPKWLSIVFNYITLPLLENITISGATNHAALSQLDWPADPLQSFLERSSCPLQNLTIELVPFHSPALIAALGVVPTLTHLQICEPPGRKRSIITDTLLRSLTRSSYLSSSSSRSDVFTTHDVTIPTNSRIDIVPRLTHIDFSVSASFDDGVLADMVESRWAPTSVASRTSGHSITSGSDGFARLELFRLNLMSSEYKLMIPEHTLDSGSLARLQRMREEGLRFGPLYDPRSIRVR